MPNQMTPLERVLTTLGHKQPDRVPLFLLTSLHGAKELNLSIRDYFSRAENVVEGQMRLYSKYQNDCIDAFFYAAAEIEAWGGEVIYAPDGPPNSGTPFIRNPDEILALKTPRVKETPCLARVVKAIQLFKKRIGNEAPIIGVAISPFSLPVMQMGFENYLDLMQGNSPIFDRLMQLNEDFCVEWANAQLEAGATAICYFDPVSSPTIIPRDLYLKTGFQIAKRTIARIKGPTATHLASGRALPIIDDLAQTGTLILGTSADEDLAEVKKKCEGKLTVLGNLNGIEMRHWTRQQTESKVKEAIARAGPGGGFILSDNHGEIPWQVPDDVLMAISETVRKWGVYPLDWANKYGS